MVRRSDADPRRIGPARGIPVGGSPLQAPGGTAGSDRLPAAHGDVLVAHMRGFCQRGVHVPRRRRHPEAGHRRGHLGSRLQRAYVSWTTDKPTDALVRFGESGGDESFLTRSGCNAELGTSHEVRLTDCCPTGRTISRSSVGMLREIWCGRLQRRVPHTPNPQAACRAMGGYLRRGPGRVGRLQRLDRRRRFNPG